MENKIENTLTSSESEEDVLSFDGPVFFRLILSVNEFATRKREEKKRKQL